MTAMTWPKNPIIYEINARVWLQELSQRYQYPIKLATVPKGLSRLASIAGVLCLDQILTK